MRLFIQIRNGLPVEHPIVEQNFRLVFPEIDTNNLPETFAEFVRVNKPDVGVYQVYEGVTYEWDGNIVKDVHQVRDMTPEERQIKIDKAKSDWIAFGGFASWSFNEENCNFTPPVPYPNDNQIYVWDEPTVSWKLIPSNTIEGQS